MNDHHVLDLLNAYLDGELADEQRTEVDTHLKECEACREEYQALDSLDRQLSDELAPWSEDTDDLARRITMQLPEPAVTARPQAEPAAEPGPAGAGLPSRLAFALSGLAAGLLLAFIILPGSVETQGPLPGEIRFVAGVGTTTFGNRKTPLRGGTVLGRTGLLRTEGDARAEVALGDGSRLRANHDSILSIASDRRLILKRGDIWIDVANRAEPFLIETGSGVVECTEAELSWWTQGDQAQLVVYSGSVVYRSRAGEEQRLRTGQQHLTTPDGKTVVTEFFLPEKYRSWTYSLIALSDADPNVQAITIRELLLGLGDSEGGKIRKEILIAPFGELAIEQALAFLAAGPWHTTPVGRRQAAEVLESVVQKELPASQVETLFDVVEKEDDRKVALLLFGPIERSSGVKVTDRASWAKIDDPMVRAAYVKKWRAIWEEKAR